MGKSAPKAPDPYKVADAQGAQNKEFAEYNAALNRINQSSPFGSISYTQTGTDEKTGAPIYSQQTSLSPELQQLLNSQISAQGGISDAISGAISRLPTGAFDPSGINTDDIRKRSFESQMATLQPEFDKGWTNLETTMSDRGIPLGSEIFQGQMGDFNRARDSSILSASRQADQDAMAEHQRQYSNAWQEYHQPYQALSSLMGNSSAVSNPTFSPFATSSASAPDLAGGIWNKYQADVNSYNQQNKQLMGGLLGLGQMAMAPQMSLFGYNMWGG